MARRIHNFSAGPAAIPTPVLEKVQGELLDYQGSGMSIMEMSHRGKHFDEVLQSAESRLRRLTGLPDSHAILFLQGGASLQFAIVPMNFAKSSSSIDFVHTGYWTQKAMFEAEKIAQVRCIASGEGSHFCSLPEMTESMIHDDAAYLHYCSNNTIYGTQWKKFVLKQGVRSVIDMSSDFLSRPIRLQDFDLVFAGAQKNVGPSGLAVVIVDRDWAERSGKDLPNILRFESHIEHSSRYHTPNTFGIYVANLIFEWIEKKGGLEKIQKLNQEKSELLYKKIDATDFYNCPVHIDSRSQMNVLFRIREADEKLEEEFLRQAHDRGLAGLRGHRHTKGIRASLYNAVEMEAVESLVEFMKDFEKIKG